MKSNEILNILEDNLLPKGFDIIHPFQVSWYNSIIQNEYKLPYHSSENELGIILGHTKYFWEIFIKEFKESKDLYDAEHPIKKYTQNCLSQILETIPCKYRLRFDDEPVERRIAFQKLAVEAGLGSLSPAYFVIHPKYGSWFAMRCVLVFDVSYEGQRNSQNIPCKNCEVKCLLELKKVMPKLNEANYSGRTDWKNWSKVRKSCEYAQEYSYSQKQLEYHYTKNKNLLKNS